jgi:hypothetical protein
MTIFIELNNFSVFALISKATQGKKKGVQGRGSGLQMVFL